MDTSGEVADLIVKEGIQATGEAVKLAGAAAKNVAALLLALAKSDHKVVGRTTARKLAKDSTPAVVTPLKKEDISKFKKLAKQYGVLYFMAKKKGADTPTVDVVSTQAYAAKLNAIYQALGYPIPEREESTAKKAAPRAPQERSSPERGNGLNPQTRTNEKPSVRGRLAAIKAAQELEQGLPGRKREHIR